tara:strand:+ start:188 stop:460 length:273 start_codon:yes stop_codon:yes gene_type:complete
MKIKDFLNNNVQEQATTGATSAGNIATVTSPHLAIGKARGNVSYTGKPGGPSGTKAPKPPKIKQKKKANGTAVNGLDLKGSSIFGGPIKR